MPSLRPDDLRAAEDVYLSQALRRMASCMEESGDVAAAQELRKVALSLHAAP